MPNLIIIRLLPTKPTDGTSFANALVGLKISATDMSVQDPTGTSYTVGTAYYDLHDKNSTNVQHIVPPWPTIPPTPRSGSC